MNFIEDYGFNCDQVAEIKKMTIGTGCVFVVGTQGAGKSSFSRKLIENMRDRSSQSHPNILTVERSLEIDIPCAFQCGPGENESVENFFAKVDEVLKHVGPEIVFVEEEVWESRPDVLPGINLTGATIVATMGERDINYAYRRIKRHFDSLTIDHLLNGFIGVGGSKTLDPREDFHEGLDTKANV